MALSQKNLPVSVKTSLGDDVLVFWRMNCQESVSQPFTYELELLSADATIKPQYILGKTAQVKLEIPVNEGFRYFHGYVTSFGVIGSHGDFAMYHATLRPWLWFLTRTADCRIFQQKSVPDIIKAVFSDLGFSTYLTDNLSGTYPVLEYCVQYRETAFNFVNRLMEREGIYYYFTHEDGKHMLVLADSHSSHATVAGYETIPFFPPDEHRRRERDHFSEWTYAENVETVEYSMTDFDFEKPKASLLTKAVVSRSHAQASYAMFDYPGGYFVKTDGDTYATTRVTERQSLYEVVEGAGEVLGVASGALFTLSQFPQSSQNREYLTLEMSCGCEVTDYESSGGEQTMSFSSRVKAIPSAQQFRPARSTMQPTVRGPQTAIVVGPSGEEIYTDQYGRIKVQFHWDRLGTSDENSSCWIRVSNTWAGKTWGAIHIPRIGQEVIVDFLEGDPDRPIVTGCVYNADQMPPYTLPDNMTQSGIKTRSTKSGVAENFNELRFEDKKDSEEIYFHAEKDFNRVVENNDTLKVGFLKKDNGDQTIEIFNNQKLVVGGGGTDAADGSQTIEIQKDRTATLKTGNEKLEVQQGNRDVIVTKGNDTHTISEGNRTVTIDKGNDTLTISQGDQTITLSAGKSTIEAATSIELKVGGSSIKIEPAKITLMSTEIDIQADMKIAAKGSMIQVNADSSLTLQGGIVKIN
jgi:type VI secretion system secreted protein VgrG